MISKKLIMFLLTGIFMLPFKTQAALEHMFLYFPERTLIATPEQRDLSYEEVNFSTADGTRLHGWYLPGEKEKPLVLFCHGNAGNISHRLDNLRHLHELGLTIFIFDYRGYGHSEGRASEEGTYADARGALSWLHNRGWKPAKMIYFGRSLGAGVALQLALEEPPAVLILESAFTSIEAMGKEHYPILFRLFGWALEARYDNLKKISRISSRLLVIHGSDDNIVPYRMGETLFKHAPDPKTLHRILDAGHNNTVDAGGPDYWRQWQKIIDHLTIQ